MTISESWGDVRRGAVPDGSALDGADYWLLPRTPFSSAIYCELPPQTVSRATFNKWIHETWYVIAGTGRMARWPLGSPPDQATVTDMAPGVSLTIPPDVGFQYRSEADRSLSFICAVAPPWPDPRANNLSDTQVWPTTL